MQVNDMLRKTQQGNNIDMELKDKYETRVHNYLQLLSDMILELQLLLFLLYFLHVVFSNYIQLILFLLSGGEEEEQGEEDRLRSKSPASDHIREKKVYNIYFIFY